MTDPSDPVRLSPAEVEAARPELAEVLWACVQAGASVNFVLPFRREDAAAWWAGINPSIEDGTRHVLACRRDGRICGTVQLVLATQPNGLHRAEIAKMLVHPDARRQGLGRRLMTGAEALARHFGRHLLVLDTARGSDGERLYRSLGFAEAGFIPDFACTTAGVLEAATVMYKDLRTARTKLGS